MAKRVRTKSNGRKSGRGFVSIAEARRRYEHGTRARYCIGKCRCSKCRRATTEYEKARVAKRRKPWRLRHIAMTKTWCVCNKATGKITLRTQDKADALKRLEKLNAGKGLNDPNELIATSEALAHILWLQAQGVGVKTIAQQAPVSNSVLNRIIEGSIKRTRRSTSQKICGVKPTAIREGARVRSDDTIVLIGKLVAAGYRRGWIAMQLGRKSKNLQIAAGPFVTVRHAREIHALYMRLCETNPQLPPVATTFRIGAAVSSFAQGGGRKGNAKLQRPQPTKAISYLHGTRACYTAGCRCGPCATANASYESALKSAGRARYVVRKASSKWKVLDLATGTPVFVTAARDAAVSMRDTLNANDPVAAPNMLVDVGPVRAHLRALHAAGVSTKTIEEATGISECYVWYIRNGEGKRLRSKTANRLLSLDINSLRASGKIDAADTWRLLDRLVAVGFQLNGIAQLIGLPLSVFDDRRPTIRIERAQSVLSLYAELRERVPALQTLEQRIAA